MRKELKEELKSVKQHRAAKPTEGHPQSDVTQRCAEFPQATQRHFNLKASIKQNLYKVAENKDTRVLLLMIDTGKIVWK